MGAVTVTVNGRPFEIACDSGQEQHIQRLARDLDRRARDLVAQVGQVGDARLMLMLALLVADELGDARTESDSLRFGSQAHRTVADQTLAAGIEALARRVDIIAERVEKA